MRWKIEGNVSLGYTCFYLDAGVFVENRQRSRLKKRFSPVGEGVRMGYNRGVLNGRLILSTYGSI